MAHEAPSGDGGEREEHAGEGDAAEGRRVREQRDQQGKCGRAQGRGGKREEEGARAAGVVEPGPERNQHHTARHLYGEVDPDGGLGHFEHAPAVDNVEGQRDGRASGEQATDEEQSVLAMGADDSGRGAQERQQGLRVLDLSRGLPDAGEEGPAGRQAEKREGEEKTVVDREGESLRGEDEADEHAASNGAEAAPELAVAEEGAQAIRGDRLGDDVEEGGTAHAAGVRVERVAEEEAEERGGGVTAGEEVDERDDQEQAHAAQESGEDVERPLVGSGLEIAGGEKLRQEPSAHSDAGDEADRELGVGEARDEGGQDRYGVREGEADGEEDAVGDAAAIGGAGVGWFQVRADLGHGGEARRERRSRVPQTRARPKAAPVAVSAWWERSPGGEGRAVGQE